MRNFATERKVPSSIGERSHAKWDITGKQKDIIQKQKEYEEELDKMFGLNKNKTEDIQDELPMERKNSENMTE